MYNIYVYIYIYIYCYKSLSEVCVYRSMNNSANKPCLSLQLNGCLEYTL